MNLKSASLKDFQSFVGTICIAVMLTTPFGCLASSETNQPAAPTTESPSQPANATDELRAGETLYLRVNGSLTNELVMPWSSTWYMSSQVEGSDVAIHRVGRSVFISLGSEKQLQLFIKDAEDEDAPKFSVMLESDKTLGPRQITLNLQGNGTAARPHSKPRDTSNYIESVVELARIEAQGQTPASFSSEKILKPLKFRIGDVDGILVDRENGSLFGHDWCLEKYRLTNGGQQLIQLSENNFQMEGVRGISFAPLLRLGPGQSTFLVLIRDRYKEKQ